MKSANKILRVVANTRKREFVLETKAGKYFYPYSQLRLKPNMADPLQEVYVDKEASSEAFTYKLKSGKEATILLDNVLWFNQDPEILRKLLLSDLTFKANARINEIKIPKRFLIRKLNTSASQLYRLLDPTCYNKTIDHMLKLLTAIGIQVEIRTRKAA
jgi:hypothetical protein